jgi:hypothetical protein
VESLLSIDWCSASCPSPLSVTFAVIITRTERMI